MIFARQSEDITKEPMHSHLEQVFKRVYNNIHFVLGRETIVRITGGMKVKADRDESSPYAAMLAAQDVAERCKQLGITALHIQLRGSGGKRVGNG